MNLKKVISIIILFAGFAVGVYAEIFNARHIGDFPANITAQYAHSFVLASMNSFPLINFTRISGRTRNQERIVQNALNKLPQSLRRGSLWSVGYFPYFDARQGYQIFFFFDHNDRAHYWMYSIRSRL